jgi:hypothetical protein
MEIIIRPNCLELALQQDLHRERMNFTFMRDHRRFLADESLDFPIGVNRGPVNSYDGDGLKVVAGTKRPDRYQYRLLEIVRVHSGFRHGSSPCGAKSIA